MTLEGVIFNRDPSYGPWVGRYSKLSEVYHAAAEWTEDQWHQGNWTSVGKRCLVGQLAYVQFGDVMAFQRGNECRIDPYTQLLAEVIDELGYPHALGGSPTTTCIAFNDWRGTTFRQVQTVLKEAEARALRQEERKETTAAASETWRFPALRFPVEYSVEYPVVDWQLDMDKIEVTITKIEQPALV